MKIENEETMKQSAERQRVELTCSIRQHQASPDRICPGTEHHIGLLPLKTREVKSW